MKLVIATSSAGKLSEFSAALAGLGIELLAAKDVNLSVFPEENADTYEGNARLKALHAAKLSGLAALADDSGLEVDALAGAPGLYSARYGELASDSARTALLLQNLSSILAEKRSARFVCSLVLALPEGKTQAFWGEAKGQILHEPRGEHGFGYDPIFWSLDLKKTFAEASEPEKRSVSHRGKALLHFKEWFMSPMARDFFEAPVKNL